MKKMDLILIGAIIAVIAIAFCVEIGRAHV